MIMIALPVPAFFFFNDTATTEIYTLSLHDALPICAGAGTGADNADAEGVGGVSAWAMGAFSVAAESRDRKSTRLNSSHQIISYAVFCLKKKKHVIRVAGPDAGRGRR